MTVIVYLVLWMVAMVDFMEYLIMLLVEFNVEDKSIKEIGTYPRGECSNVSNVKNTSTFSKR